MRLPVVLAVMALLAPTFAQASIPGATSSRVWNMRLIAVALYGPSLCGDTMAVPIGRGPMPDRHWLAYSHRVGDQAPFTDCRIVVKDMRWTTEGLCRVITGHEFGHLAGYRAPEGEEYVGPKGIPDYDHKGSPLSIMWPFTLPYFAPCANGAADAIAARPSR